MVLNRWHQGSVHSGGRVIKGPLVIRVVEGVEVDERNFSHGQSSHQSSASHSLGFSWGKGCMVYRGIHQSNKQHCHGKFQKNGNSQKGKKQ